MSYSELSASVLLLDHTVVLVFLSGSKILWGSEKRRGVQRREGGRRKGWPGGDSVERERRILARSFQLPFCLETASGTALLPGRNN